MTADTTPRTPGLEERKEPSTLNEAAALAKMYPEAIVRRAAGRSTDPRDVVSLSIAADEIAHLTAERDALDKKLTWLLDGAELERYVEGAEWVIRIPLDDPAGLEETVWKALSHAMEPGSSSEPHHPDR